MIKVTLSVRRMRLAVTRKYRKSISPPITFAFDGLGLAEARGVESGVGVAAGVLTDTDGREEAVGAGAVTTTGEDGSARGTPSRCPFQIIPPAMLRASSEINPTAHNARGRFSGRAETVVTETVCSSPPGDLARAGDPR